MNITKLHLRWDLPLSLTVLVVIVTKKWLKISAVLHASRIDGSRIPLIISPAKLILLLRIDELEDEIIREKLKINAVSGQLDDTFNEMLNKY